MRKELKKIENVRTTFTGTVDREGLKNGWKGEQLRTFLVLNVKNAMGELMCDHIWFNLTKGFAVLNLCPGDVIQFDARVTEYEKGYKGWNEMKQLESPISIDYRLSYPTRMKVISRAPKNIISEVVE